MVDRQARTRSAHWNANICLDNGRANERIRDSGSSSAVATAANFPHVHLLHQFCRNIKQPHTSLNMASAHPTTSASPSAPVTLAPAKLGNFRDLEDRHSDASDSDQSDASGRSLSPTRQGLSKTKKRKERRQFGAFADELGDLLGAAFQSKDESKSAGLAASTHAGMRTVNQVA